jgi:hypothetical protein
MKPLIVNDANGGVLEARKIWRKCGVCQRVGVYNAQEVGQAKKSLSQCAQYYARQLVLRRMCGGEKRREKRRLLG